MHDGLSLKPYGSISLFVLVRPRVVDTTFDIILKSDLFRVNFGISWLASMNRIISIIHKCLKFSHKGVMHIMHGTR